MGYPLLLVNTKTDYFFSHLIYPKDSCGLYTHIIDSNLPNNIITVSKAFYRPSDGKITLNGRAFLCEKPSILQPPSNADILYFFHTFGIRTGRSF